MSDDLNPIGNARRAVAVMKMKLRGLECVDHFYMAAQLPVVVPGNDHNFATRREIPQQLRNFARRGFIVDQIAKNNEAFRRIFIHEFRKSLGDRRHPPHRHEAAGGALAQFISKMQVRDGEPALSFVKKRQAAIQKNFIGDQRLVRS